MVKDAVKKELERPGRLLGYTALHKKIREVHGLNVRRRLVYDVLTDVNPKGIEERGAVGKRKTTKNKSILIGCMLSLANTNT